MTNEKALSLLKTSTSVEDWNSKRNQVRLEVTHKQWEELHRHVDAYGLIVEVLGPDPIRPKYQKQ